MSASGIVKTSVDSVYRLDGSSIGVTELTARIEDLIEAAEVTGLNVAIINDGVPVFQRAFGLANAEKKDTMSIDHTFTGASLSKSIFGFLVAKLAIEGQIDLDKPLQEYLPVPIPQLEIDKHWRRFDDLAGDNRYRDITARMCLSHTTGFPNWRWLTPDGFDKDGKLYIRTNPGVRYGYSGEGMHLLQYVLEHITDIKLEDLARMHIFEPLNMEMTSYIWQDRFEQTYCNGHTTDQTPIEKVKRGEAGAAGSLETNLADYTTFMQHILDLTNDQDTIIDLLFDPNIRIRSKMQFGPLSHEDTSAYDSIQLSYGLGWGLLQSPFGYGAFKEGHDEGFQHYSILFPEQKIGVLFLSNSDNAESIFKALLELTIRDTFTPWKWENYIPYNVN